MLLPKDFFIQQVNLSSERVIAVSAASKNVCTESAKQIIQKILETRNINLKQDEVFIFFLDLDNTLINDQRRINPYATNELKNGYYDQAFYESTFNSEDFEKYDSLTALGIEVQRVMEQHFLSAENKKIIFVCSTARSSTLVKPTLEQLQKFGLFFDIIMMRGCDSAHGTAHVGYKSLHVEIIKDVFQDCDYHLHCFLDDAPHYRNELAKYFTYVPLVDRGTSPLIIYRLLEKVCESQ